MMLDIERMAYEAEIMELHSALTEAVMALVTLEDLLGYPRGRNPFHRFLHPKSAPPGATIH